MNPTAQHMRADFSAGQPDSRLPLIVRTAADVTALRKNSRAVRRLPARGVKIAIDGLDPDAAHRLKTRMDAYIRSCGCAAGAASALVTLLGVLVFIGADVSTRGVRWSDLGIGAMGMLLALLVAGIGKLTGLTLARFRFERCCEQIIRIIEGR